MSPGVTRPPKGHLLTLIRRRARELARAETERLDGVMYWRLLIAVSKGNVTIEEISTWKPPTPGSGNMP